MKHPACKPESVFVRAPEEAHVVEVDNVAEVQSQHVNAAMSIALNQARRQGVVECRSKSSWLHPNSQAASWEVDTKLSLPPLGPCRPLHSRSPCRLGSDSFLWEWAVWFSQVYIRPSRDSDMRFIYITDLDKSLRDREEIVGRLLHHIGTMRSWTSWRKRRPKSPLRASS